jgi:hypothetical protein
VSAVVAASSAVSGSGVRAASAGASSAGVLKPLQASGLASSGVKADKLARQRAVRDAKLGGAARSNVAGSRTHVTMSAVPTLSASSKQSSTVRDDAQLHLDTRGRANSLSRAPGVSAVDGAHRRRESDASDWGLAPVVHTRPPLSLVPAPVSGAGLKSKRALAVFSYRNGGEPATMPIVKGEIVHVERELNAEWWLGRAANGTRGLFPSAYVRPVVASSKARALFDFVATRDRHLPFVKGEIITVLRADKAWWDGMANGRFGSFPGNYVRLLDDVEAARLEAGDDDSDDAEAPPLPAAAVSVPMGAADARKPRLYHIKGKEQVCMYVVIVVVVGGDTSPPDHGDQDGCLVALAQRR